LWSNPQRSQQVMREKKRLEHLLATDADLGRRGDDIAAYFDLAKEVKVSMPSCGARLIRCVSWLTNWRRRRCSPGQTTR